MSVTERATRSSKKRRDKANASVVGHGASDRDALESAQGAQLLAEAMAGTAQGVNKSSQATQLLAGSHMPMNQGKHHTCVGYAFSAVMTQNLLNKYAVPIEPEKLVEKVMALCPCWTGHWPSKMCEEWNNIHQQPGALLQDTDRAGELYCVKVHCQEIADIDEAHARMQAVQGTMHLICVISTTTAGHGLHAVALAKASAQPEPPVMFAINSWGAKEAIKDVTRNNFNTAFVVEPEIVHVIRGGITMPPPPKTPWWVQVIDEGQKKRLEDGEQNYEYDPYDSDDDNEQEKSQLGSGSFGSTHRMRNKSDKQLYAVKLIRLKRANLTLEKLSEEAAHLARLNHPHIVRYFTSSMFKKGRVFAIVTELLPGGSFSAQIRAQQPSKVQLAEWVGQVASALAYMHRLRMQHRDLKPDNVLFDGEGHAKIIDLGLSCILESKSRISTQAGVVGTTLYMSPEKGSGKSYNNKDDVWALGCILSAGMVGKLLEDTVENKVGIFALNRPGVEKLIDECRGYQASALVELVVQMLAENPEGRPSARDAEIKLDEACAHIKAEEAAKVAEGAAADDVPDAALASVGLSHELIARYSSGEECAFWFVKAERLRALSPACLPKLQDLRADRSDWLEQKTIRFVDVCSGAFERLHLVISHRWEEPAEPDGLGVQATAVQEHLRQHPEIEWVWYDFSCMPQGEKTPLERVEFRTMLPNINLLYLGCSVLVLLDLSYLSRFWTQFEAYLSLRQVSARGLADSPSRHRLSICCIHGAPASMERALLDLWESKTPEEACALLSQPDVTVTNQSDKEQQLPKLLQLNALAGRVFGLSVKVRPEKKKKKPEVSEAVALAKSVSRLQKLLPEMENLAEAAEMEEEVKMADSSAPAAEEVDVDLRGAATQAAAKRQQEQEAERVRQEAMRQREEEMATQAAKKRQQEQEAKRVRQEAMAEELRRQATMFLLRDMGMRW